MLLVDVRIEQYILADSLTAYQSGSKIFLPIGEIARMLTIAIRSQPAHGSARGFVRGEERSFSLSVAQRSVSINGKTTPIDVSLLSVRNEDIYVESKLLGSWLSVDFDINLSNLSVMVRPREPLPLQLRLSREQQMNALGARGSQERPKYPLMQLPYALAGVPFIDQTVTVGASRVNGNRNSSAASTTFVNGDLLGLQAAAFINASREVDSRQSRLTLGRVDPQGEQLGLLKATSFAFGSVSVPGITFVTATSDTGNGVTISNSPIDRPTSFNSHTMQGELPPGWDVELFFNEALVAYQQARADGKYVFADQPLVYGANEFRLVFHGPQGQLRVERYSFLIDESSAVPGSFFYTAGSHRDIFGRHQSAAHIEMGLGGGLTISADSVRREPATGATIAYNHVSMHGYANTLAYTADFTRSTQGGTLAQAGLKTRISGFALDFEHFSLHNFVSDLIPVTPDPLSYRDRLRMDGLLSGRYIGSMPVTVEVQRDKYFSGASSLDASAMISRSINDVALSNLLHLSSSTNGRIVNGAMQVASGIGQVQVRGQVSYELKPGAKLSAVALSTDTALAAGYLLNVSAVRTFADGSLRINASINRSFGTYALALNGGIGPRGEAQMGIQFFTSLGRDPRRSQWVFDSLPMTRSGAVSARVFIDKNGNGVMDEGEQPVADVGFILNGSQFGRRTDAAGLVLLDHLPADHPIDLSVDLGSLEDPQLSAQRKGVRLIPRQGNVAQIDFPLALTGEIDGTVSLATNGTKRGIGNVLFELVGQVNGANQVVASTRSSADGFFIFEEVLPGAYQLRVAPQQLVELGLADPGERSVRVLNKGAGVNGQNFLLSPR